MSNGNQFDDGLSQPGNRGLLLPPWERRERFGFLNGLYLSAKDVLLAPGQFFRQMPSDIGLAQPLLFAIVVGVISAFLSWMWTLAGSSLEMLVTDDITSVIKAPLFSFMMFVTSPVLLTLGLFVSAGLMHLILILLQGNRLGFEATFRVAAYCGAALLLSVIPFCGSPVSLVWYLIISVIGLYNIHEIEPWKAIIAVVIPIGFCFSFTGISLFILS